MNKYRDIEDYLDQNDARSAFEILKEQLQPPGKIENANDLKSLLLLMSRCFEQFEDEYLHKASNILSQDINSGEALYQLGFKLTSAQHPDIAVAILSYGLEQDPKDVRLLHELVAALEIQGLYKVALNYLKAYGGQEFTTKFLLAFNTLMIGDIVESEKITTALQPNSPSSNLMINRLRSVFERKEVIKGVTPLDKSDYRGWHFILTGGLLLHLPNSAKHKYGQYESLEDSGSLIKEGIYRMCSIFDLWNLKVPRILSLDNPESHRLGLAFSDTLGIPEKKVVFPDEAGLFVFYDHSNVISEVMHKISIYNNNIHTYCHGSQFNREYKVAPDFTNLMYSRLVSPWDRHTIFPTRPDLPTSAPTESDHELVKQIISSEIDQNNLKDLQNLLNLAEAGKTHAAGGMSSGTSRARQWFGRKH